MRRRVQLGVAAVLAGVLVLPALGARAQTTTTTAQGPQLPPTSANVTVFAPNVSTPRGLTFGPDGSLYVAQAGPGGNVSTVGTCTQVAGPVPGPYTGAPTGAGITKVSPSGAISVVTSSMPTTMDSTGATLGVAAVAFVGTTMYALEEGGGCSHGNAARPNGVYRINADGTATLVADLSYWVSKNPVKVQDVDFEPDGNWFNMIAVDGMLYALDANRGELVRIDPTTGVISRVVDISASQGHSVPTSLTYWNGNFYVGNLGEFPIVPGTEHILKITPAGIVTTFTTGLTAMTGLTVGGDGSLYALEMSTAPGNPTPGTGMVVRIDANGNAHAVATGLTFPTGITTGPDGNIYISNVGFGIPAGEIVRFSSTAVGTVTTAPNGARSASFTVSFSSKNPGRGIVLVGTGPGCMGLVQVATGDQHAGTTSHTVTVTGNDMPGTVGNIGIQPGRTYFYETETVTPQGNEIDNNNGTCYSVTIPAS
jgi:hypothetical protein